MQEIWYEIVARVAADSLLALTLLLSAMAVALVLLLYWTGIGNRSLVLKCGVAALMLHLSVLLAMVQVPAGSRSQPEPVEIAVPIELRADSQERGEPSIVEMEEGLAASVPTEPDLSHSRDPLPEPIEREVEEAPTSPAPEVASLEADLTLPEMPESVAMEVRPNRLEASPARDTEFAEIIPPPAVPTEETPKAEIEPELANREVEAETAPAELEIASPVEPIDPESPPVASVVLDVPPPPVPSPEISPLAPEQSPAPAPQFASRIVPDGEVAVRPSLVERPSRMVDSAPVPAEVAVARTLPTLPPVEVRPPPRREEPVATATPARSLPTPAAAPKSSTDIGEVAPRFDLEERVSVDRAKTVSRPGMTEDPKAVPSVDIGDLVARSRPAEPTVQVPAIDRARFWENRTAPNRLAIVVQHGGSEETEKAVGMALEWLAAHQSEDGRWDSDGFDLQCPAGDRCEGHAIETNSDTGLTGLALLAFLGAGHTHLKASEYQETVRRGLSWLIRTQRPDGDLQLGGRIYAHSMATLALSEALAMTGDERIRVPAQKAVLWLAQAQHAESGGWRYGPNQFGDTSVFGWAILALRSARSAGLDVPAVTWARAQRWIPTVISGAHGGLAAYRPGYPVSHAMTAETLFCRQVFGGELEPAVVQEATEFVLGRLPDPNDYHLYYWYYGTLSMFQVGGEGWKRWNNQLSRTLLSTQRQTGHARGSWDPQRPFGVDGGRVFSTAASAMCLEVYYRYLPLYSQSDSSTTPLPR